MPWKVTRPMDEKVRFAVEAIGGEEPMAALCRAYSISRPTGYKWLARYHAEGLDGLRERSRARHNYPNAVDPQTRRLIIEARVDHPTWGPRKLLAWLARRHPSRTDWPAASTVGDWLRNLGLAASRKRSPHASPTPALERTEGDRPNRVWTVDFKGWFRVGDATRCDPLTIMDDYSRYLLLCRHAVRTNTTVARGLFERLFHERGLPEVIRSDNGAPFASNGLGGLSRLSVWLMTLDVRVERIDPGKPQQNGRHERMHRTLKAETARPPADNIKEQQRRFDRFTKEYNDERPHESLEMETPASRYEPSGRPMPLRAAEVSYHDDWPTRKVQQRGEIHWAGQRVFLSETLSRQHVGFEPLGDGQWRVWFASTPLARFDERRMEIEVLGEEDSRQTTEAKNKEGMDN